MHWYYNTAYKIVTPLYFCLLYIRLAFKGALAAEAPSPMCCWRKLVSSANPKKEYYVRFCIRYICSTRTNLRDVNHHAIFIFTLHSISQALSLVALSNPDLGTTKDFLHHARSGKMCVTLVACLLQVPDRSYQRSVTLLSSAFWGIGLWNPLGDMCALERTSVDVKAGHARQHYFRSTSCWAKDSSASTRAFWQHWSDYIPPSVGMQWIGFKSKQPGSRIRG